MKSKTETYTLSLNDGTHDEVWTVHVREPDSLVFYVYDADDKHATANDVLASSEGVGVIVDVPNKEAIVDGRMDLDIAFAQIMRQVRRGLEQHATDLQSRKVRR